MLQVGNVLHTNLDIYVHPVDRTRVDVVGMVHFADAGFYHGVQSYLDDRTMAGAHVQYEGVTQPKPGEHIPEETVQKIGLMAMAAQTVGDLFTGVGLASQQEVLEYRPSWSNSDISMAEVVADIDMRSVIEFAVGAEVLAQLMGDLHPSEQREALFSALQRLGHSSDNNSGLMGPRLSDALLDKRNEAALGVMDRQKLARPNTDFVLVWGEGHLPGLGVGLSRRGYHLKKQRHLPAISL